MRCFVAIGIDAAVRARLEAAVDRLRRATERAVAAGARISWTRPGGWHVTLKFLGELAEERLANVGAALSSAVGGFGRFDLTLSGLHPFPAGRAPHAIAAGVKDEGQATSLAASVDAALSGLGFAREDRPFHAHITLARLRDRAAARAVREVMAAGTAELFGTTTVESVGLYQSVLGPGGAQYHDVARFALGARM